MLKATPKIYFKYLVLIHILFIACYFGSAATVNSSTVMNHFYFEFEKNIPIIPWMIFIYISTFLMSIILPFLLTDKDIKYFVSEVAIATVLASIFFYFFPTQLGFDHPKDVEYLNFMFQFLWSIDTPNNLFPSLHVTYSLLFSLAIFTHLRSITAKATTVIWFILLCSSVIYTHQHHLLDIPSGIILAIFSKWIYKKIQGSRI